MLRILLEQLNLSRFVVPAVTVLISLTLLVLDSGTRGCGRAAADNLRASRGHRAQYLWRSHFGVSWKQACRLLHLYRAVANLLARCAFMYQILLLILERIQ